MTSEEKNPLNIVHGKAFILLSLGLYKNSKPTNSPSCMLYAAGYFCLFSNKGKHRLVSCEK